VRDICSKCIGQRRALGTATPIRVRLFTSPLELALLRKVTLEFMI
jgi:hypothetical protein